MIEIFGHFGLLEVSKYLVGAIWTT